MRVFFKILFFVAVFSFNAAGQGRKTDSLLRMLEKTPPDSNRVKLLLQTAEHFYFSNHDSCLSYSLQARDLAKNLKMAVAEITALNFAGEALRFMGDYPEALGMLFKALKLSRQSKNQHGEASSLGYIGFTYIDFGEYRLALQYLLQSSALHRQMANKISYTFALTNIGHAYDLLDMPDSALYYQLLASETYIGLNHGPLRSLILIRLGDAYEHTGQADSALNIYHRALANSLSINAKVNIHKIQAKIANLYLQQKKYDSSILYARQAYVNGKLSAQKLPLMESSQLLSSLFRQSNNPDSALFYQDIATAMRDSLYGAKKFRQLQHLMLDEQQRQQQAEQEQQRYRNKIKYIILFIVLGVFLLVSFLLLRNNRLQQKAKAKVEAAYSELQDTQQQLVQREKMASLGELTAGIAHEIQNPLNFVNNFSEVNMELIEEMKQALEAGQTQDVIELANDIRDNNIKITHHGKRADSIVKGMLKHSRTNGGQKELTDINILVDECLRLSYHGIRARDKTFNAKTETDFDNSIGKISIVPQDIGRVILNLFTNAFYSVMQKKKQLGDLFEPIVTVKTLLSPPPIGGDKKEQITISIRDNGNGVPQNVIDKIFQPFFTTKPVGEGTGLGLSMSYEIINMGHNGELKVETREGEYAEFIIVLPI